MTDHEELRLPPPCAETPHPSPLLHGDSERLSRVGELADADVTFGQMGDDF